MSILLGSFFFYEQQNGLKKQQKKNRKQRRNEEKQRKSIRETCPHFQCGTRQSLVFGWVHEISVLAHFCDTFFPDWHKFVTAYFGVWYSFVPEKKTNLKIKAVIFLEKS